MDTPIRQKSVPLEEGKGLAGPPDHALIYAYGRSQNAPLDRMMPLDVLWEALGVDATQALLDVEGIRAYREADSGVPYRDPRVALKVIQWIYSRERPGAQEKIDDACRDIVVSLEGLDARMEEYHAFVDAVGRICGAEGLPDGAAALRDWANAAAAKADTRSRGGLGTPLRDVTRKTEGFRSDRSASFTPFSSTVTHALTERLARLANLRAFAKDLRDRAGLTMAQSAESRDVCERLRDLCGQVLRNRCYLEGDWRGEEPIGGPEVSYDEIENL